MKAENRESIAFKLIVESGEEGILQRDVWKTLKCSDREVSRIVARLEHRGLIRRERELVDGRWTYRIYAAKEPVMMDSIIDCPCTACSLIDICGSHEGLAPETCDRLTAWLTTLARREEGK